MCSTTWLRRSGSSLSCKAVRGKGSRRKRHRKPLERITLRTDVDADSPLLQWPTTVVYDGHCPLCARYVSLVRIRRLVGDFVLHDARTGGPLVAELLRRGYDLDRGLVLIHGGEIYFGAESIHQLALISTRSTLFNRVHIGIFRHWNLARALFPFLRTCRRTVLRLLGRKLFSESSTPH